MHTLAKPASTCSLSHSASDPLLDAGNTTTDQQRLPSLKSASPAGTSAAQAGSLDTMHRLTSMAVEDLDSLDLLTTAAQSTTRSEHLLDMPGTKPSEADYIQLETDISSARTADQKPSSFAAGSRTTSPTMMAWHEKEPIHSKEYEGSSAIDAYDQRLTNALALEAAKPTAGGMSEVQAFDDDTAAVVDQSATQQHKPPAAAPAGAVGHLDNDQKAQAAETLEPAKPEFKQGLGCPIGVRFFTDKGIDLSSRQNPFIEAFALVTMAIYLGMVHLLMLLLVASFFSRTALLVNIGVWCTLLLPAQLLWEPFLANPVWRAWRRYFRFSVIMEQDMELVDIHYVIPEYPHGVFPLSQLIAISLTDIWPNHPIYSIAADSVFHIPLWKHVMTWIGALPATAANFKKLLNKGSVGLIPGGIAEMFMNEDDCEVIKLLDRKGFVRIAVEMGKPLLPCYHFGNSRLFKWGPKSWEQAARRHRVALGFLFGRWGLPFALPNRVPLMMVVGGPIPVKQTSPDDPNFAAAVDEAHGKLVEAMQQLYDKYKGEYGWADRPLIIK